MIGTPRLNLTRLIGDLSAVYNLGKPNIRGMNGLLTFFNFHLLE